MTAGFPNILMDLKLVVKCFSFAKDALPEYRAGHFCTLTYLYHLN